MTRNVRSASIARDACASIERDASSARARFGKAHEDAPALFSDLAEEFNSDCKLIEDSLRWWRWNAGRRLTLGRSDEQDAALRARLEPLRAEVLANCPESVQTELGFQHRMETVVAEGLVSLFLGTAGEAREAFFQAIGTTALQPATVVTEEAVKESCRLRAEQLTLPPPKRYAVGRWQAAQDLAWKADLWSMEASKADAVVAVFDDTPDFSLSTSGTTKREGNRVSNSVTVESERHVAATIDVLVPILEREALDGGRVVPGMARADGRAVYLRILDDRECFRRFDSSACGDPVAYFRLRSLRPGRTSVRLEYHIVPRGE